ncbi:hypothetical protein GCM10027612_54340 [Microbispora bryophytorum subsp. camponoti]
MTFCPELSDDLRELRNWVHEFARDVVRPAGVEWDEREETPWPVIQEAAKIGLYSLDFFAQQWFEESGLGLPVAFEELFWGDAGIGLSIVGTGLAAASIAANGTPEQMGEWLPQMFGTADDVKLGAFCSSEPDAGSDVGAIRTRAVYDEAKDEWVLNGVKTWVTNGGIADVHVVVASVDPTLGTRGQASFVVPPGTRGLSQGQKFKSTASAPRTPPRSSLTTYGCPAGAWWAARRSWTSGSPGCAPARGPVSRPRCGPSRPPARSSPPWPSASPVRPTSTPGTTPGSASSSAAGSGRTRPSRSCSPTWPPGWTSPG